MNTDWEPKLKEMYTRSSKKVYVITNTELKWGDYLIVSDSPHLIMDVFGDTQLPNGVSIHTRNVMIKKDCKKNDRKEVYSE